MQLQGYMNETNYTDGVLTVTATNKAAQVALRGPDHADGPLVLNRDQIAAVEYKPASRLTNGRVTIRDTNGSKYVLHFRRKQAGGFTMLAHELGADTGVGRAT